MPGAHGAVGLVSDDTQMPLLTAEGVQRVEGRARAAVLTDDLAAQGMRARPPAPS
ncbi:hypothetical protein [Streptomyces sp. ALI-76-A]|uniref:hypothetical protein n=1 Tax=Streptomyces sp. ALI-76-A TaxID=3025736 RepID=UPI00256F45A8|nr:hypothetical protein [Streptomyces sp. ALI-76-A]MDL5204761.1 hypothetical protein [Streptomyces sp. ALI-76-A]